MKGYSNTIAVDPNCNPLVALYMYTSFHPIFNLIHPFKKHSSSSLVNASSSARQCHRRQRRMDLSCSNTRTPPPRPPKCLSIFPRANLRRPNYILSPITHSALKILFTKRILPVKKKTKKRLRHEMRERAKRKGFPSIPLLCDVSLILLLKAQVSTQQTRN